MSRGMSEELISVTQGPEIRSRLLVTVFANEGPVRFVANATRDLVFDGETYTAAEIKRGEIKTTTDGDKEQMPLTLSNRWQGWAAYVANNGPKLKGCKCRVEEVFLDYLEEGSVWRFEGVINKLKMNIAEFSCVVERDSEDYEQEGPTMDYGPICQFTYKDSRCRAASSLGPCDSTPASCEERGNITRYQGHISIPKEMVIRG